MGQTIGLVGTPYTLNYRSDRVPGRQSAFAVTIPASGASMPASAKRIEVAMHVAGQRLRRTLPPAPNQRLTFVWDGRDAYGRLVMGRQRFAGSVDFVYDAQYKQPGPQPATAFAQYGGSISLAPARQEFDFTQGFGGSVGVMDARGVGAGGWTLSAHHAYDPGAEVLYLGTGRRISAGAIPLALSFVAGNGTVLGGNGIPATQVQFAQTPRGLAVAADGSIYVSEVQLHQLHRIDPAGIIVPFAGTGTPGFSGDGGPAISAQFRSPRKIATGPDGSVYVIDAGNLRIRRIESNGIVTTVAGNGLTGTGGDGGLAINAGLGVGSDSGLALAGDGTLYVAASNRIRRVGTDGIISTVAGGSVPCTLSTPLPNGIPASNACFFISPSSVAIDAAGTIFVGFGKFVARIDTNGIITLVAGPVAGSGRVDGIPATQAEINVDDLALGADGTLFVADRVQRRIRAVSPAGVITTAVGTDDTFLSGTDIPILRMSAGDVAVPAKSTRTQPSAVKVAPDGSLLFLDTAGLRERIVPTLVRARPPLPVYLGAPLSVASPDGGFLYQFDQNGRHLRTRNTVTGAIVHEFGYDAAGRLTAITEKTGGTDNVTTIQRDSNGHPTAIVAPFGQVTQLQVDGNGYVVQMTDPANQTHSATYTAGGLMQSFTKPGNRTSQYQHDADGRLVRADDPAGGFQSLARTNLATGHEVARTTALARTTRYVVDNRPNGDQHLTTVEPDGTQAVTNLREDSVEIGTAADGTTITSGVAADPRFGTQARFPASVKTMLPSGLTRTEGATRSVVLSDPNNVLSLTTLTDSVTVNSRTTTGAYTAATRTNVVTTPAGRTLTTIFDGLGRATSTQVGPLAPVTYSYDSRGRLLAMAQGGRSYSFTYGAQGFLQSMTDPLGRTFQYARDAAGRTIAKTMPDGATLGVAYDAAGDVASVTPPGRTPHTFAHDGRGAITAVTPPVVPGGGPTAYAYDQDRHLAATTHPGGESIAYSYDAAGRLSGRTLTNFGGGSSNYGIAYDAAGRVASVSGPGAQSVSFNYDGGLVRTIAWAGPVAGSRAVTYDDDFRIATESVNGGPAVTFGYNADGLLMQAGELAVVRSPQTGLVQSTALGIVSDSYTRNALGEATAYTARANATPLYAVNVIRDASGRIAQRQETIEGVASTFDYAYDLRGRLVAVTRNAVVVESYAYDANGNRTSATVGGVARAATHDAQDRLIADGPRSYAYSPTGRLVSRTIGAATTAYRYDAVGNLVGVTLPAGTVIDYQVDGMAHRVGKSVGGVSVQKFLYAGLLPIAEFDGAGILRSRFVFGTGLAPTHMSKGGDTFRIITDPIGSVRLVVNAATGAVAQRIDYDSFGNVTLDTNPGFQPFGFASGLYDPDTRLTRFGVRDYDAESGRWTAKDPTGLAVGTATCTPTHSTIR